MKTRNRLHTRALSEYISKPSLPTSTEESENNFIQQNNLNNNDLKVN